MNKQMIKQTKPPKQTHKPKTTTKPPKQTTSEENEQATKN